MRVRIVPLGTLGIESMPEATVLDSSVLRFDRGVWRLRLCWGDCANPWGGVLFLVLNCGEWSLWECTEIELTVGVLECIIEPVSVR